MTERFKLPVWLRNGPEITKLSEAFSDYWDKAEQWLKTPLNQTDAEQCHVVVLKLLAYQRDVDRFAGEPDELFRKRVAFAVKNAKDAGSMQGMKEIFERFDLPLKGQVERDPEKEWDVITLWLGDSTITENPELGQYIVRKYGRTCRRYEFLLVDAVETAYVQAAPSSVERQHNKAASVADWVFADDVDGYQVGGIASNWMDRSFAVLPTRPVWELRDVVSEVGVTFWATSLERSVDSIRGNE